MRGDPHPLPVWAEGRNCPGRAGEPPLAVAVGPRGDPLEGADPLRLRRPRVPGRPGVGRRCCRDPCRCRFMVW